MRVIATVAAFLCPIGIPQDTEPRYTEPLSEETLSEEAAFFASTLTTEERAPKQLVAEVREVLARVRRLYPEVACLPVEPPWNLSGILLRPDESVHKRLKEYRGDLAAFDFDDAVLNRFRDRCPLEKAECVLEITGTWELTFKEKDTAFNIRRLTRELRRSPRVAGVLPNLGGGDGNELHVLQREDRWLVIFKKGWGDCNVGCIYNAFWYFEVTRNRVELVERTHPTDKPQKEKPSRIYRWGTPSRLSVTVYDTFEDIVKTARAHSLWWHRAHALRSAASLVRWATPQVGEDGVAGYAKLHEDAVKRRDEVVDLLIETLGGKDSQIRAAAETGLMGVYEVELGQDPKAWREHRSLKK